jgi:NAD(P)-dependent dehydrogenase (short-subunit alcohol dehydrogenase family)
MSDLAGRVAIVTGATGVLGTSVVSAFLDAGAHVAAPYRSTTGADELRSAIGNAAERLTLESVDVSDEVAMARFAESVVARFGRIDALAALAGGFAAGPVADTGIDAVRALFEQNLVTAYAATRGVLPHMRARAYGRIVCVGARPALRGARNTAGYAIAKTGVVRLVESLADEVKDEGITVNAVLPSTIDHPVNRANMPKADPKKWVQPAELAAAIVFLCSPEASGITGAAIPVFGRM